MKKDQKKEVKASISVSSDLIDTLRMRRRKLLQLGTGFMGGIGAAFASWPFIRMMSPSARAEAAGVPVKINLTEINPGQLVREKWRGRPVWVVRRTPDMLKTLKTDESKLLDPDSKYSVQPPYAKNVDRSIKPEYLVLVGICTHLGCSPTYRPIPGEHGLGNNWPGGFFCSCHGSKFDMAGRVFKNVPARKNLVVPPYKFSQDGNALTIGLSAKKEKA